MWGHHFKSAFLDFRVRNRQWGGGTTITARVWRHDVCYRWARWGGLGVWIGCLLDVSLMRQYGHFHLVGSLVGHPGHASQLTLTMPQDTPGWSGQGGESLQLCWGCDLTMDKWNKIARDSSGHVVWWFECISKSQRFALLGLLVSHPHESQELFCYILLLGRLGGRRI